jgi:16S rRNA processing protein RimM
MNSETSLTIGRVVRPHGLKGETVVRETTFSADEFSKIASVTLVRPDGGSLGTFEPRTVRQFGQALLVQFVGIDHVDRARELQGASILVERSELPAIGEDQVYYADLVGLEVFDEDGRALGSVTRVLPTAAHEVLEVSREEQVMLIPYHPGVVLSWDREAGRLNVRLPAGLEDIYQSGESKEKKTGS